jgi:integrase
MAIFKRGKFYWFEFELRGVRYQRSTRQGDREAAKRIEAQARTRVASGGSIDPEPPKPEPVKEKAISVNDLFDALESDFKIRGKWTVRYQSAFSGVRGDFGAYDAKTLTARQVDAYIEKRLAAGARPATINRATELLRQAYRFAIKRKEGIEEAPLIRHLSEKDNARKGFFSAAQFESLAAHLPEDLRDFARFGFLTGWRKNEIASLKWSDVEDGVIRLRGENSKSREPRQVPIEDEIAAVIERRRAAQGISTGRTITMCELIFHRDGQPVREFRKSWKRACAAAGLGHMLFHDLRRSAVRNMVRGGVHQNTAMKISGHKTASMFRRYDITDETDLRQAMLLVQRYNAAELAKSVNK